MSKTILITGANGKVGSALVKYLDAHCPDFNLILADLKVTGKRSIRLDVSNIAETHDVFEKHDIDVVIHLAGLASPDTPFEHLLPANIIGTYNIFQSASDAGVKRIIYASSAQTIESYPLDVQVKEDMPVRPKNLYGVSKAFGEALGAYYAYQTNVEVIAIRIGAFEYADEWCQLSSRDLSAWSEPDDLSSLILQSIESDLTNQPFMIAHGISDNRFKRLDISETKDRLGYDPQADAFKTWNVMLPNDSKAATLNQEEPEKKFWKNLTTYADIKK